MKSRLVSLYPSLSRLLLQEVRLVVGQHPVALASDRRIVCPEISSAEHLKSLVKYACDGSIYTALDKMAAGFIPCENGVRMGLAGEFVVKDGKLYSVRQIGALVIRFAHEIKGCSDGLPLAKVLQSGLLVVSPPGGGKTTYLRDVARRIALSGVNVVVLDERGELSGGSTGGRYSMDLGGGMVVGGAPKRLVCEGVVRALNPKVVVTDELAGEDVPMLADLSRSGVVVVASMHARWRKAIPQDVLRHFGVVVTLSDVPKAGSVVEVWYG